MADVKTTYQAVVEGFCRSRGIPIPKTEFRFSPPRRWRFDFAWPSAKVALEIEGAVYAAGRHVRGSGYESDCEKYSVAAVLGWRVLRVSTGQLQAGLCWPWLEELFARGKSSAKMEGIDVR